MSLKYLLSPVGLLVLRLEVEHQQGSGDADDDLSCDCSPKSGNVTGSSILLSERYTGNDTSNTTSGDTILSGLTLNEGRGHTQ